MKDKLVSLIHRYIEKASQVVILLKKHFGEENLLFACNQRRIQRVGAVDQLKVQYSFHGSGCHVKFNGESIDFDFDARGSVSGTDLWKLMHFVENEAIKNEFPEFTDEEELKKEFNSLVERKLLLKGTQGIESHQFFLLSPPSD